MFFLHLSKILQYLVYVLKNDCSVTLDCEQAIICKLIENWSHKDHKWRDIEYDSIQSYISSHGNLIYNERKKFHFDWRENRHYTWTNVLFIHIAEAIMLCNAGYFFIHLHTLDDWLDLNVSPRYQVNSSLIIVSPWYLDMESCWRFNLENL